MRVVRLDGRPLDPSAPALSVDDPAVRWGEGLFETMRAGGGRVPLLERHLARLAASARTLGLEGLPSADEVRTEVAAALAAFGGGPARVRLTVTPRPTLLVEVAGRSDTPPQTTAIALRGAWLPGDAMAEHKSLSYARLRMAQRRAEWAGAGHALLLDEDGRMGEAAVANVFCAVGGELVTAPVRGLLPGVARAVVLERVGAREEAAAEDAWRAAPEIVVVNAVRGAQAVVSVNGTPVGDGRPGPWARRIAEALEAANS
ncbi:MAG: aminotransferase class IV [Thermoleophilia bacterium]